MPRPLSNNPLFKTRRTIKMPSRRPNARTYTQDPDTHRRWILVNRPYAGTAKVPEEPVFIEGTEATARSVARTLNLTAVPASYAIIP